MIPVVPIPPPPEKLTAELSTRVKPSEAERFAAIAASAGMSRAALLRSLVRERLAKG